MPTRARKRTPKRKEKPKPQRGGVRPGAGRKSLFTGKRVRMGIKITELARGLVADTVAKLAAEHGEVLATDNAAVEYLIRAGAGVPLEMTPPTTKATKTTL